jgi:hypothetical protein
VKLVRIKVQNLYIDTPETTYNLDLTISFYVVEVEHLFAISNIPPRNNLSAEWQISI